MGCTRGQGWLYAKAMPLAPLLALPKPWPGGDGSSAARGAGQLDAMTSAVLRGKENPARLWTWRDIKVVLGTGIEPVWPCGRRIFVTLRLSPPAFMPFDALDYALTLARAVGPRRLVSTPSPGRGLARRCLGPQGPGSSPNLTGFTRALSPPSAQFFKSFVSTYFTTRASDLILVGARSGQSPGVGAVGQAWQSLGTISAVLLHPQALL